MPTDICFIELQPSLSPKIQSRNLCAPGNGVAVNVVGKPDVYVGAPNSGVYAAVPKPEVYVGAPKPKAVTGASKDVTGAA